MAKKVIVAESYEHYIHACQVRCLNPKEVPFITTGTQLEHMSGPFEPIYIGRHWDNPAHKEIERVLRSRGIMVNGQYIPEKKYSGDFE